MAVDGMEAMASAALFARTRATKIGPQEKWEQFASKFANWLVQIQSSDGSFFRAYNPDGSIWYPSASCSYANGSVEVDGGNKLNSDFPIRFLVEMYFITGNYAYANAAKQAGDYSMDHIFSTNAYVGGTDQSFMDRESGMQALHAALALYDLAFYESNVSEQALWLANAQRAAEFLETWQFIWSYPVTDVSGTNPQYKNNSGLALSLNTLGSSTSDIYLSIASFDFYRLHLLLDDSSTFNHFGAMARLFDNNTKITTQLSGLAAQNFGWKYDGLAGEAITLASFRLDAGNPGWLPWVTNSLIEPSQKLTDAFGSASVEQLLASESDLSYLMFLRLQNHAIYPIPGTIGWTQP